VHHPFRRDGFVLQLEQRYPDFDPEFAPLWRRCASFTETSPERMYALYQAVCHVADRQLEGDIVECGVWRGGSAMLAALTLQARRDDDRNLQLYDTFAGMTEPSEEDVDMFGLRAREIWDDVRDDKTNRLLAVASLDEVRKNVTATGIDPERVTYVVGKVEDTIPDVRPERIALLRLDTDWYASTYHELVHLYPSLVPGGVIILDDYGYWAGARQAAEEYFGTIADAPLLSRIDYTGRIGIKPEAPPSRASVS
jgi:hypothetical protein